MLFNRVELSDSVDALIMSFDIDDRCVGRNYRMEENVAADRVREVEAREVQSGDIKCVVRDYFDVSIQGNRRGHRPSTFDPTVNAGAILGQDIEPNQKIVRLQRIDGALKLGDVPDFDSLKNASQVRDKYRLSALTDRLRDMYSGERPMFATFKSEVEEELRVPDWPNALIERLGLYHMYPYAPGTSYSFALMEYTAGEVISSARQGGLLRCFALPTVLESQHNPAFFPVPAGAKHGHAVNLGRFDPARPGAGEILHARFDCAWHHVKKIGAWGGAAQPNLIDARARHRDALRVSAGRPGFGGDET
jgi:hypothetical protein